MKKASILILFFVLSMLFSIAPLAFSVPQVQADANSTFSIMQITDTQHLAMKSPALYNDLTEWMVDNAANYNLKMVVHTGDFINAVAQNPTPPPPYIIYSVAQKALEWEVASAAMSKLLVAGIPYCWLAGNHDPHPPFNPSSNMPDYPAFDAPAMGAKSYWVSDIFDSKNTAVKFSYNDYDFMFINIEYLATPSVMVWMVGLLDQNPGVNVIVTTHTYLNENGGYGSTPPQTEWALALKATLDNYSNVFLVLSGHFNSEGAMTSVGNRQEILFDRQDMNSELGAASVRIYTFNLATNQVDASTYCLYTDSWLTDAKNEFIFSVNLIKDMFVGEGRVDLDGVRYQGDATVFVKSATIDVDVDGYLYTWIIYEQKVLNNIVVYNGDSGIGRIKLIENNGCVVANGPEIFFQCNER